MARSVRKTAREATSPVALVQPVEGDALNDDKLPDELQRLRSLLLREDRNEIAEIRKTLRAIDGRVGTDEEFAASLQAVLLDAIAEVRRTNGRQLNRTLAPLVVETIRSEVRNSREELVNALYPLTGKMVAASMRDAVERMTQSINDSVERASNPTLLLAKAKSKITGRPMAAHVLAGNAIHVDRAILIDRRDGTVLCSYEREDGGDTDLVSGLIAALSTFASQTYSHTNSDLRTVELDGHRLILRHSPIYLLALEVGGDLPSDRHGRIDELFLELVSEAEAGTTQLSDGRMQRFAQSVELDDSNPRRSPAMAIIKLLVLAAIGFAAYTGWQSYTFDKQVAEIENSISADPTLRPYGLRVTGSEDGRKVTVSGLVGAEFDATAFTRNSSNLVASDVEIVVDVIPVAGPQETARILASLEVSLTDLNTRLTTMDGQREADLRGSKKDNAKILDRMQVLQNRTNELAARVNAAVSTSQSSLSSQQATIASLSAYLSEQAEAQAEAAGEAARRNLELSNQASIVKRELVQMRGDIATLSQSLEANEEIIKSRAPVVDSIARLAQETGVALNQSSEKQQAAIASVAQNLTTLAKRISEVESDMSEERSARIEALQSVVQNTTITFDRSTTYSDAPLAEMQIEKLASAIISLDRQVEILGHSDRSGSQAVMARSALNRAQAVRTELEEAGVPARLLTVRSMGAEMAVAGRIGRNSPDRRVTFEIKDET